MRLVEPKSFGYQKPDPNPIETALTLAKTYDHQATFGTSITF
jgi:hypothetical protein